MAPPSGEATVEAEAARETNGCGTEWRSGSEDVGDTVGGTIQEERTGRLPCKEQGACLWGQGLCQGLREAMLERKGTLSAVRCTPALGGRRGGNRVLGNQTLMYQRVESKIPKVSEENNGHLK